MKSQFPNFVAQKSATLFADSYDYGSCLVYVVAGCLYGMVRMVDDDEELLLQGLVYTVCRLMLLNVVVFA